MESYSTEQEATSCGGWRLLLEKQVPAPAPARLQPRGELPDGGEAPAPTSAA